MTEREKIIELAKSTHGCYFPENSKFPPYQFLTIEALESFYRSAQASEDKLLKALENLANLYCYKSGNLYHDVTRVDVVAAWKAAKKAIATHKSRKEKV